MKIYEAVSFIPPRSQFRKQSKFESVWEALINIGEKYYLPVECRSISEASHLKQECTKRNLTAERRQKTVFIQGCALAAMIHGIGLPDPEDIREGQYVKELDER